MYPLRYTKHTKHTVSLCVLKLLKVEKRIKGITAYTRIQLFQGYSFEVAGYSAVTPNDFLYPSNGKIQSTPDNSNLQGKLKKVRVIGSSKKIAGSKVKNSFYCTVNILITFYCRNVKWKLKDTFRLKIRTLLNKTLPK